MSYLISHFFNHYRAKEHFKLKEKFQKTGKIFKPLEPKFINIISFN
jgi:hypothetical protein